MRYILKPMGYSDALQRALKDVAVLVPGVGVFIALQAVEEVFNLAFGSIFTVQVLTKVIDDTGVFNIGAFPPASLTSFQPGAKSFFCFGEDAKPTVLFLQLYDQFLSGGVSFSGGLVFVDALCDPLSFAVLVEVDVPALGEIIGRTYVIRAGTESFFIRHGEAYHHPFRRCQSDF